MNPDAKPNGRPIEELTEAQKRRREYQRNKMRERQGGKPGKLIVKATTKRKMSEETKGKIRKARIAFLEANPHMVPYKLHHYSKGRSWPEQYFFDLLTAEGVEFIEQHQIGLYSLDFAFPNLLIDLEINGAQHYDDPRIVASDIKRKAFLEDLGWTQIVVDWRAYQRLDFGQRTAYVADLLARLRPARS